MVILLGKEIQDSLSDVYLLTQVKGQMLVYKFCKLPYKYEPGVTRSSYQERFKRLNSSLRQSEPQTSKPFQPQIIFRSLPATSAIPPPATPVGKRLSWPVGPIPTPQVCFCSGPVSCSSSLCFYRSRIFYPDSWSSESCGFRPIEPVHSELRQTLVSG